MAGIDTAYLKKPEIHGVIALSREETRTILSRNSRYAALTLASDFFLITSDNPTEQLHRVLVRFKMQLDESSFLTRCLECNELLEEIDKDSVAARLYPYVAKTQERIFRCPKCDKLYWHATHAGAIVKELLTVKTELGRAPSGPSV